MNINFKKAVDCQIKIVFLRAGIKYITEATVNKFQPLEKLSLKLGVAVTARALKTPF